MRFLLLFYAALLLNLNYCYADPKLVEPGQVEIGNSIRKEELVTELGIVSLRWPRISESLFGRTPLRAVTSAMKTTTKTLARFNQSFDFRKTGFKWDIVFIDDKLPLEQIPSQLVTNCHPAWMTAPSNLYFVSQRIVAGCEGGSIDTKHLDRSVSDTKLERVLLHEIGHAVEYQLLQAAGMRMQSQEQAEGFATWFESYASQQSLIIPRDSIKNAQKKTLRDFFRAGYQLPAYFSSTVEEYIAASLPFYFLEDKKGVAGILEFYRSVVPNVNYKTQIMKILGWQEKRYLEEVKNWI